MTTATPGISALGIALPRLAIDVGELATLRGVDPAKYRAGLGCGQIALCDADEDVVSLAVRAAQQALSAWDQPRESLGLLAVGTETARDMSRPLSAFVADELGLTGALRSYEVKHACYGGTLALRQALEWQLSGAARGKAALVIAADVALYAPRDPGEPTQGAGAVAMLVDARGALARPGVESFPYSEPAFDFWRPVGEAFPRVQGQLSLDCYKRAAAACFGALQRAQGGDAASCLQRYAAMCFHAPFPRMVEKAFYHVATELELNGDLTSELFETRVRPTLELNRKVGNCYTASLWLSVAAALARLQPGQRLLAFSYGSGFGAELLQLDAGPASTSAGWLASVQRDLDARRMLGAAEYARLRAAS